MSIRSIIGRLLVRSDTAADAARVDRRLPVRREHEVQLGQFREPGQRRLGLGDLRKLTVASVRTTIGGDSSGGPVKIAFADRRGQLAEALLKAGTSGSALLVSGESGVGKSALTLSTIAELEAADPSGFEAVVVNFRGLSQSSLELRAALGMSMEDVLAELSAPKRVLVVDAADAVVERSPGLLTDLVLARLPQASGSPLSHPT